MGCFGAVCGACTGCVKRLSVGTVSVVLRVLNIINAALLGVCCFVTFVNTDGSTLHFFLSTWVLGAQCSAVEAISTPGHLLQLHGSFRTPLVSL